jgi:hypothetical protein
MSSTTTKKTLTAPAEDIKPVAEDITPPVEEIKEALQEGLAGYEKSLKSAIQLQEETVAAWKELLEKTSSPEAFKKSIESLSAEIAPAVRKEAEEFAEGFKRTTNQALDLFEKSVGVYQAASLTDAQRRVQDLMESAFAAVRVNVHATVDASTRLTGLWKEILDRSPIKSIFASAQSFVAALPGAV